MGMKLKQTKGFGYGFVGLTVVQHLSLPSMNSFNKTEAATFPIHFK